MLGKSALLLGISALLLGKRALLLKQSANSANKNISLGEKNYILRVGALMFHAVGQLSTHQMTSFHTKSAILPVGYKATRIYWASNVSTSNSQS